MIGNTIGGGMLVLAAVLERQRAQQLRRQLALSRVARGLAAGGKRAARCCS